MNQDIRWQQRFSNYSKALNELQSAVLLLKEKGLSKLEKQGLIQCFEYTHELAWKTLKDFLEDQGLEIFGSKDAIREAYKLGIIADGEIWMQMIKSHNLTSHIYDEKVVDDILNTIVDIYFPRFQDLSDKFAELKNRENIQ